MFKVASFLGWCDGAAGESWAIIGDLTALYDLNALAITPHLQKGRRRLVVVNNGGGRIFDRLFSHPGFLNPHQFEFSAWAKMFGWDYQFWSEVPESVDFTSENIIIEIKVPVGERRAP